MAFAALFAHGARAQSSLASRVLVVYAANDSDSVAVATYYQQKRGIPNANLCSITLPDIAATLLTEDRYAALVKAPVRACLTSVGAQNILYIVLAYTRPYAINTVYGLYALDSYLADVWDEYAVRILYPFPPAPHPYYADAQSQGESYIPFQSLADYRAAGRYALIYSVWRLDGATPAAATALVDKALAGEAAGGLFTANPPARPNACVDALDNATLFPDTAYRTADWDLYRIAQLLTAVNDFNVITDQLGTSFGNGASPLCPNTGLYVGWYNYGTYNDAFTWNPGAIGWDLNSSGMVDPREGQWWSTNALKKGVTITSGAVTEPYLDGLTRPYAVRNMLEGANAGDAFLRNTRWLKWRIINAGDPLYKPFPDRLSSAPAPPRSLQLTEREVVGGGLPVGVTLTLSSPAPTGGLAVNLSTSESSVTAPAAVTVPGGANSVNFTVSTSPVAAPAYVILTAATSAGSVSNSLALYPVVAGAGFKDTATGGSDLAVVLSLNLNAPLGGLAVQFTTDRPDVVSIPASVRVPPGLPRTSFTIATAAVPAETKVRITASYGSWTASYDLTLTP